ncbi:MAG TPA: nucleotidyltransferase family protein [Terracidiphilus sp.]|jgi:CTP:molybdopterin cytidylyltransferase MocA|nr:nucleotidyltransferase family protein [Terracidiphilus sp.]
MTVAAIVLAAGASRRLGQPKQLLMHGGEMMIERAIRLVNEAGAAPVITVLGAFHELIREAVQLSNFTPVINNAWNQGISTSIQAGLAALLDGDPQTPGALILACDQPRLSAEHLRAMLEAFCAEAAPAIVASSYQGVLGIPAVFPREVFAELCALRGDKGARSLLMQPPCPLVALPFSGGEIDIDLPADMTHLE